MAYPGWVGTTCLQQDIRGLELRSHLSANSRGVRGLFNIGIFSLSAVTRIVLIIALIVLVAIVFYLVPTTSLQATGSRI